MTAEAQRPRTRILTAVVALLFAVGAIPVGLLGERLSSLNRDLLEVQQQEYQLVLAEAIARELGEFVRAKQAQVEGFSQGLGAASGIGANRDALTAVEQRSLLNSALERNPELAKLMLAVPASGDARGSHQYDFVVAERGGSAAYAEAMLVLVSSLLGRGFEGQSAIETPPGEPPALIIVSPVRSGEQVVAVLAAVVELAGLRTRLAAPSEELYLIYVSDRTGTRLLSRSSDHGVRESLLSSNLAAAFRESGGGTRTMPFGAVVDSGSRPMLGAFATAPDIGWGVFVETDADAAYYAVRKMRETTIVWTCASIVLALVLGYLFAHRLVLPIGQLAEGARRLARGDFSQRIHLKSRNELGVLADSFNHMADEIQGMMAELRAAATENKELFLASIRMLAEAIDEKDPYTRGHSERVARYAVAVARAMQLPVTEIEKVHIGALLHDVGKIGIDDRILRKPTVLTDAEFEIMKQHPEKGAHIMSAVRELADIIPGMRYHHEKIDGSGYPLGLKGEDIPLAAQIISVADTFDAMTTDRPYQRGMEPSFVVDKLRGWVGSRFRADVVTAFEVAFRAGAISARPPQANVHADAGLSVS